MLKNLINNTNPQIVHAPDDTSPLWHKIKNLFLKLSPKKYKVNKLLSIITWNNLSEGICELSLKKNNIPFSVLGSNIENWCNLMKFDLTVEFLKSVDTPYCIGLDSHDVIFYGDPNLCLERFLDKRCDIVFNSEINFYPNYNNFYFQECKNFEFQVSNSKFCYLNSGAWIGKREFALNIFQECSTIKLWNMFDCKNYPKITNCDQSVVHGVYKKYYPRIKIDTDCNIFQNIAHLKNEVSIICKWFL